MKTIGIDISVLNDRQRSGIGVYTYGLIKTLLSENTEDKFILFGFATYSTFDYLKNIEFNKYPNVELKIYKMPAKFFRTFFLLWQKLNWPPIENLIGPVDIFHSFNWYLPPQKSGKVVATVFDMTPLIFPKYHLQKTIQLDRIRLNRIRERADLVITISQNSKKDFLKFSPKSLVEVIYPGVGEQFKGERGKGKDRYILSVGTLEPRKNIKNLITAYLKSKISEKLVLAGNWGWEDSGLGDLIKTNSEKIILIGYVPDKDLPYLYNQALCLVYPSFYEGFGIPVLEAQASGCPVITSFVSSLPEAGGKAAVYVDPNSTEDIIRAIKQIKKMRKKLIKKGYENIKRFSWKKSAKKLNFLYQQL